jgi:hypothetical protein
MAKTRKRGGMLNFTKKFGPQPEVPKFKTDYNSSRDPPVPSVEDKYKIAIDAVTNYYGNSKQDSDKIKLKNLLASITGLQEEEKAGETTDAQALTQLKRLVRGNSTGDLGILTTNGGKKGKRLTRRKHRKHRK